MQLLKEINQIKKKKAPIEIILISSTVICLIITGIFLCIYKFHLGYWSIGPIVIFTILLLLGIYENKIFKIDLQTFCIDILYELKEIDLINLSDFINSKQGFFGANYVHSSHLLNIYKKLINENVIKAKITETKIELIE